MPCHELSCTDMRIYCLIQYIKVGADLYTCIHLTRKWLPSCQILERGDIRSSGMTFNVRTSTYLLLQVNLIPYFKKKNPPIQNHVYIKQQDQNHPRHRRKSPKIHIPHPNILFTDRDTINPGQPPSNKHPHLPPHQPQPLPPSNHPFPLNSNLNVLQPHNP